LNYFLILNRLCYLCCLPILWFFFKKKYNNIFDCSSNDFKFYFQIILNIHLTWLNNIFWWRNIMCPCHVLYCLNVLEDWKKCLKKSLKTGFFLVTWQSKCYQKVTRFYKIAEIILKHEFIFLGTNIFHCYSQEHEKLLSTCERIDGKISWTVIISQLFRSLRFFSSAKKISSLQLIVSIRI
jgi:hypothetical protein